MGEKSKEPITSEDLLQEQEKVAEEWQKKCPHNNTMLCGGKDITVKICEDCFWVVDYVFTAGTSVWTAETRTGFPHYNQEKEIRLIKGFLVVNTLATWLVLLALTFIR